MVKQSSTKSIDESNIYQKLLHLEDEASDSKDHLGFLLSMIKFFRNCKPLVLVIYLIFFLNLWAVIYYFVQLLITFDSELIVKYGGYEGIQIFMLICIRNAIVMTERIVEFGIAYQGKLLPLNVASRTTKKKILLEAKFVKIVIYTGFACSAISASLFCLDKSFNENEVYFFVITKKMIWTNLAEILTLLYRTSYFFNGLMAIGNAYIICYIGFHAKFQIMITNDFIEHICDDYTGDETNQYYSEVQQKLITERLKICIMLHQFINREVRNFMEMCRGASLLLLFGILILGGGIMIQVFRETDIQSPIMACAFIAAAGFLNGVLYIVVGQTIKDESENLRMKLLELPWYNMNMENKRILFGFLIRSINPIAIENAYMQSDFNLMVRIFRVLYSLSTIVSQSMRMKND